MAVAGGPNNNVQAPVTEANISGLVIDSLIAYYDTGRSYSYSGSGSTWNDLSGNSRNVTLYNAGGSTYSANSPGAPTYANTTPQPRGQFNFDGVNDWGKFSAYNSTTNFSFAVWIKTSNSSSDLGLLSHCSGGPVGEAYEISAGKMRYWYYNGAWYTSTGTSSVSNNTWKNLVWTRAGTSMKMYINGSLDYSVTNNGTVNSSLACLGSRWGPCNSDSYGAGTDSYGTVFSGSWAIAMIYNKELSGAEVTTNFTNLRSRFGV